MHTVLLFSSNWNNGVKASVGYLNSNNVATNSNHNIGRQLSLEQIMVRGLLLNNLYTLPHKRQNTILSRSNVSNENENFAFLSPT